MASSLTAAVATVNATRGFKQSDAVTRDFVWDFLRARGQDDFESLTQKQQLELYLQETIQHQKEVVGAYRGQQELARLEAEHQQEIEAAKVGVEAGVDV